MPRYTYSGRVAVVTGASSGIGAEFARQLAADGARVVLAARREDRMTALADEIAASGAARPLVCRADLVDAGQSATLLARVEAEAGPVDVLVNNAGFGDLGPLHECDAESLERMVALNVAALARLSRLVAPGMVQRKSGVIINVASVAGFTPMPLMAAYGASKAFVVSLSEAMHVELRPHGVGVCCVCPGTTRTEFFERGGFEKYRDLILKSCAEPRDLVRGALRAAARGKMTYIHGAISRVQTWLLTRVFPRRATAGIVGFALKTMRGAR